LTILPADPQVRATATLGFTSSTHPGDDGRFSFGNVPPGTFIVQALTGLAAGGRSNSQVRESPILWASTEVDVQGRDWEVPLALQPALTVSGRIEIRVATPIAPAEVAGLKIALQSIGAGSGLAYQPSTQSSERGTFSVDGVMPGLFRVSVTTSGPRRLFLLSASVDGHEILDSNLEVGASIQQMTLVLTDRPSEVVGTLQDSTGKPATGYFILMFPTDQRYWGGPLRRCAQVRPATDGSYVVRNLPSGDYWIVALADVAPGDASDPVFLAQLVEHSVKIKVSDGTKTVPPLRIGK
jgi:hypothetical protein